MPRVVSFIVLLAIILLIGSMFFQVMVQFIVPLFLAAVLVVIFKPLHQWVLDKCGHRTKLSAAVTTLLIVLMVLLPLSGMVIRAVSEGAQFISEHKDDFFSADEVENAIEEEAGKERVDDLEDEDLPPDTNPIHIVINNLLPKVNESLTKLHLPNLKQEDVRAYVGQTLKQVAAPLALGGVQFLAGTLVSLAIMVLTLYYFFSDGPNMVVALMKLSPLEDTYEQELLDKFADVSRAVVVAVLLSAIVQGVLAGIGYYFAGIESIFLLTVITCFMAMVPFVGAASVWVPTCVFLYFYTGRLIEAEIDGQITEVLQYPDGRPVAAIVLAVYCMTVVSMIDNVIKPLVLHGQSNLHPLLALLSVIGGIQVLGPIGILVGPMLVAFLQALLNMLNKELHLLGQESDATGQPVVFATAAGATKAKQPPRKGKPKKKK